jgi:hypothetical protein
MQNVDFSKRKPKIVPSARANPQTTYPKIEVRSLKDTKNKSLFDILQQKNQSIPGIYILVGGILLFTAGFILGMKTDQKEALFSSNEAASFRNINSEIEQEIPSSKSDDSDFESSKGTVDKEEPKSVPVIPKNIQFPPKPNQVNYIIQMGTFSKEDATRLASSLIREKQEFQGRIFKTTTGKLYAGYFYNFKDAKVMLKKLKKFQDGTFSDASIKNIQF